MMVLMLSEYGFAIHAAEDGQSGIAAASTMQPEIALVDIDLPDMSGYEVARRLKNAPATAGIKLIAVTGYGQAMDRERALASGFDRHLTKPVPIEDLAKALDDLLADASASNSACNLTGVQT